MKSKDIKLVSCLRAIGFPIIDARLKRSKKAVEFEMADEAMINGKMVKISVAKQMFWNDDHPFDIMKKYHDVLKETKNILYAKISDKQKS